MKRFLTSLPVIIALATAAALALMFIIVDDPSEKARLTEIVDH